MRTISDYSGRWEDLCSKAIKAKPEQFPDIYREIHELLLDWHVFERM